MKASVSLGDKKRGSGALLIGFWVKVLPLESRPLARLFYIKEDRRYT